MIRHFYALVIDCGPPPKFSLMTPKIYDTVYQSVVLYTCNEGYESQFNINLTSRCQLNGAWSKVSETCESQLYYYYILYIIYYIYYIYVTLFSSYLYIYLYIYKVLLCFKHIHINLNWVFISFLFLFQSLHADLPHQWHILLYSPREQCTIPLLLTPAISTTLLVWRHHLFTVS